MIPEDLFDDTWAISLPAFTPFPEVWRVRFEAFARNRRPIEEAAERAIRRCVDDEHLVVLQQADFS